MKHYKKLLGVVASIAIIFCSSVAVYAADPYHDCGSKSGNISVQSYSSKYNATWTSIIDNGLANWNNSSANVSITASSSSSNPIEAAQYNDSWYGLATQKPKVGNTLSFTIQINSRTISEDATNFSNFATSTVVHEFGHIFWLCDNPNTTKFSIMKHDRNRNTMTTPQQFDIDNVNAKY